MESWDFPETDRKDRPEPTPENVPDDVLEKALRIATSWSQCPNCEVEQFVNVVPGHNSNHDCRNCGETYLVVG